jgi:hypothetical protein
MTVSQGAGPSLDKAREKAVHVTEKEDPLKPFKMLQNPFKIHLTLVMSREGSENPLIFCFAPGTAASATSTTPAAGDAGDATTGVATE